MNADSEERRQALCDFALPKNIQKLHDDLGKYRIQYDKWFNESTLHKDGSVQRVIEQLKASGHTYEKDGALWFKTTEFGDERIEFSFVKTVCQHILCLISHTTTTSLQ